MHNNRYIVSRHEPYAAFKAKFDHSKASVVKVAHYLAKQGLKVDVGGVEMRDPKDWKDKGDIWVLKDDGTPDYRVEVRQLCKESFTSADEYPWPMMVTYFCIDWHKLDPKPAWVYVVNAQCTHAAKVKCGNEVANWLVTNAPKYSSYAVMKDKPEYVEL